MYRKIEISGFRGADKISLDKLGQINVLVGKNNAGKSSCLEAISLLASGSSGFMNAFGENSLKQALGRRVRGSFGLQYLRHVDAAETRIIGHRMDGSGSDNLVMGESPYSVEPAVEADIIGRLHSKMCAALSNGETVIDQAFFYFYGENTALGALYVTRNGLSGIVELDQQRDAAAGLRSLFVDLGELGDGLHDRLADSGKLRDVIKKLHKAFPSITDIRQIRNMLHVCKGDAAIPFYLTGDGFQASLMIMAVTVMLERGVLILEEPENDMHPGLVSRVVHDLLSACQNNNLQIFISSHSDELVRKTLEMQEDANVSVHHVGLVDGEQFAESFNLSEAKERRLDLQLDLRGLW